MAIVTLKELRNLIRDHTDWKEAGMQEPHQLVAIDLKKGTSGDPQFAPTLAKKTVTYEGRDITVVLDFDEQGYLVTIELV